jgi:lambda family phage portal protein
MSLRGNPTRNPTKPGRIPGSASASNLLVMSPMAPILTPSVVTPNLPRISASSGAPYESGGQSRRTYNWQTSRLGPTTLAFSSLEQIRARSRDQVRNNPYATAAADNFESQAIGNGIRPRWNLKDKTLKKKIEDQFRLWSRKCDASGRSNFYGLQATAAREIFESGEVLVQRHLRPSTSRLPIPMQIQLIEGDQLPLFRNFGVSDTGQVIPVGNYVRTGIEFDPTGQRVAYHCYKHHPGETMFYPDALEFMRVPASDMLHVYKPVRAGLLRGLPHLTSVLALLYELDQYNDAELVRKKVSAMFVGFIKKTTPDSDILPLSSVTDANSNQTLVPDPPPGVSFTDLESGTVQELLPGEEVTWSTPPTDSGYEDFLRVSLHRFAIGCGATYEQVTGDLKGVSYSSIRAGLIDFRRKCEQFQTHVFMFQFCQPIAEWFLEQAVLSGALILPGYAMNPDLYHDIHWISPGWPWVSPLEDVQASVMAIRGGLDAREHIVAESGKEVETVDDLTAASNKRADELGLVYDTDPRKIGKPGVALTKPDNKPEDGNLDEPMPKPMPKPMNKPKKKAAKAASKQPVLVE